jgi:hypothetical protein
MRTATLVLLATLAAAGQDSRPATIDSILGETWYEAKLLPQARATDVEFLRRVSLDLTGIVPTEQEVAAFLRKPDRTAKIDELLASPRHAEFLASAWATSLYGYLNGQDTARPPLEFWLRKSFADNTPYDQIVRELLTGTGRPATSAPASFVARYYMENGKPEEIAVKVSRAFLGIRLNCARCHDHPFDKWTQDDFYQFAAFFKGVERKYVAQNIIDIVDNPERASARYYVQDLKKAVKPRFLSGAEPQTAALRDELALFVVTNRQFARAFANRLWYHFFGRGLVHPIDNFSKKNPPAVPKLLDFLTDEAIRLKFDTRAMIRMIVTSKAYQLSSSVPKADPLREKLFAQSSVRALAPEQVTDSIMRVLDLETAMGRAEMLKSRERFIQFLVRNQLQEDLTSVFEYRESIQDVMTKMTIDLSRARTGKGFLASQPSVERIYLATLSRPPSARERKTCDDYLKRGGSVEELVVTLLNSHEFTFNH